VSLGDPVIAVGGIAWAGLLAFFLRTPSAD
jgi:hypothetical protein